MKTTGDDLIPDPLHIVRDAMTLGDPCDRMAALLTVVERDIVLRLDRNYAPEVAKEHTSKALIETLADYRRRGSGAALLMEHCVSDDFWDAFLATIIVDAWSRSEAKATQPPVEVARSEAKRDRNKIFTTLRQFPEKRTVPEHELRRTSDPLLRQTIATRDTFIARKTAEDAVPLPCERSEPPATWVQERPSGSAAEIRRRLKTGFQGR